MNDDTISRQAAIDECNKDGAYGYISAKELMQLPTITAERRGKWERVRNDDNGYDFRCSFCHRFRFHNGELRRYKYCPNCGATMEGDE